MSTTPPKSSQAPGQPAVLREDADAVAILTLNRPLQRNTLSEDMLAALAAAVGTMSRDDRIKAVVLAAAGPAFCAGHDLKEMTARRGDPDGGRAYFAGIMETCSVLMQSIVRLPQPVVAAVQGMATAAGCQLVASCDLAVASSEARFCTPGVDIGLFCSTPMVALTRNVAPKHAMEMLLTGEPISAPEARRFGLVNRVVAAGRERAEAIALARTIAGKSATAVRLGKQTFHRQIGMTLADAYRVASQAMVENMLRADAVEGIGAFLEKRAPAWNS